MYSRMFLTAGIKKRFHSFEKFESVVIDRDQRSEKMDYIKIISKIVDVDVHVTEVFTTVDMVYLEHNLYSISCLNGNI